MYVACRPTPRRFRRGSIELPTSAGSGGAIEPGRAAGCPSVQLCVERLRLRAHQFSLDDASAPYVAAICRATDGVPLLIELAAGQLGRRTLPEIAATSSALWSTSPTGTRIGPTVIATWPGCWTGRFLLGEERDFFLRLGVFHGGFDAEAAAAVTDESRAEDVPRTAGEAHLVSNPAVDDYMAEHPRYRLLGATAAYCRACLRDELLPWRRLMLVHYGTLAGAAGLDLSAQPHGPPSPR